MQVKNKCKIKVNISLINILVFILLQVDKAFGA